MPLSFPTLFAMKGKLLKWTAVLPLMTALFLYTGQFAAMHGMIHFELLYVVLYPMLLFGMYLIILGNTRAYEGAAVLLLILVGMQRLYWSDGWAYGGTEQPVAAIIMSEPNSTRGDFVESWFIGTGIPYRVDVDVPAGGFYFDELSYTHGCDPLLPVLHGGTVSLIYRARQLMQQEREQELETGGWLMFLESDAKPLRAVHRFRKTIKEISKQRDVDLIWLDYRDAFAGYTWMERYFGTNGWMVNRATMDKVILALRYRSDFCAYSPEEIGIDLLLGWACMIGELRCTATPLLIEHDFETTLDYSADRRDGMPWPGFVFIYLLSLLAWWLVYKKTRA